MNILKLQVYLQSLIRKINHSKEEHRSSNHLWKGSLKRDDNSRIKAGKMSTLTKFCIKKQICLLNDTIKNIMYAKFLSENTTKISYCLFCKLKPFWVVKPKEKDKRNCLFV